MQTRSKTDTSSEATQKSAKRALFPEERADTKKKEAVTAFLSCRTSTAYIWKTLVSFDNNAKKQHSYNSISLSTIRVQARSVCYCRYVCTIKKAARP